DSQLQIELAPQLARLLDALRRVVKLQIWLDPPEQVGRKRDVSIAGVLLDHVADMRIHAEDFLNDHYAGSSAAPGRRQIAIELSTICSGDRNHLAITHRENSLLLAASVTEVRLGLNDQTSKNCQRWLD